MSTPERSRVDDDYQQYLWGESCPRGFARKALVARRLVVELVAVPHGVAR